MMRLPRSIQALDGGIGARPPVRSRICVRAVTNEMGGASDAVASLDPARLRHQPHARRRHDRRAPVVVELFTSQGCSSCPPANAYLNELARSRRNVLALAFHVTYWDRLGWKDSFSLHAATDRQDRYGHRFGDGSYTSEIVVDGASSQAPTAPRWDPRSKRPGATEKPRLPSASAGTAAIS